MPTHTYADGSSTTFTVDEYRAIFGPVIPSAVSAPMPPAVSAVPSTVPTVPSLPTISSLSHYENAKDRAGKAYRRYVPSAGVSVGTMAWGKASDKANVAAHIYIAKNGKNGLYWAMVNEG
jgi:hypothetical protein